jgi:hypothetical protein
MTSTINASTSAGLVNTADTSGVLALQTAGTTAVSIDASQVVTLTNALAEASGGTGTTTGYYGFKNRIINGAMVISQRNGTSATTVNGNDIYTLDRYKGWASGGGVFTVTQSTTAPTGFNNSSLITVTTADASIAASDNYRFAQVIEGYNIADLGFGTASASTVTLSFWVRSSITGTFGGSLYSVSGTRAYVFNYTISAANTWEQKTVTIAGDTSGTWGTTNSFGITVYFDLGSGSNYENATGSWVAAEKFRTSGNATLISTLSNTWYVTGVQLEKGSTATSFDYRPYGTEIQLCQRYYELLSDTGTGTGAFAFAGYGGSGGTSTQQMMFKATKRATPSITINGTWAVINCGQPTVYGYGTGTVTIAVVVTSTGQFSYGPNTGDDTVTASAEL